MAGAYPQDINEVKTAIEQTDYLVMVLPFTERTNHFLDKEKLFYILFYL